MDHALYEKHFRLENDHWWFLGRRALVLQTLGRYAADCGGPVLDVGCGTGGMLPHLRRFGRVIGLDTAAEAALSCAKRGMPFVLGSATELPFDDESFGIVTALDVLEHVSDDGQMLQEIFRVVRPGGTVLFTVPAYQFLWSRHDEFNRHYRRYRRSGLRRIVQQAKFDIVKLTYYNAILFPLAVLRKAMMRFEPGDGPASHLDEVPGPLNAALRSVLMGEKPIVAHLDIPFGASIICAARRPTAAVLPCVAPPVLAVS